MTEYVQINVSLEDNNDFRCVPIGMRKKWIETIQEELESYKAFKNVFWVEQRPRGLKSWHYKRHHK